MDILVYIRNGHNEELRYAIRSWCQNLNFRKLVVVSGSQPPLWLKPDILIKNPSTYGKVRQAYSNIALGLENKKLATELLLCMDDTFVLKPIGTWESGFNFNRGTLTTQWGVGTARHGENAYTAQVHLTHDVLKRWYKEPLSFELHAPFWCETDKLRRVMETKNIHELLIRSLYGNRYKVKTAYQPDLKVATCSETLPPGTVFCSTTDTSFTAGKIGQQIRALFPKPSKYER